MATHLDLCPAPSRDLLRERFVGKSLKDLETPAAVIDLSITQRNCQKLLEAMEELGFGWRAHIKTHKTAELTRLQLGSDLSAPANIVVSTINEAEFILPTLKAYSKPNLLYGLPPGPSSIPRLSNVASELGPGGLSLLIDHADQLPVIEKIHEKSGVKPLIFIKIDMGGHRAGVLPSSETSTKLFTSVVAAHSKGYCTLHGLYSHAGHSYGSSSQAIAMDFLRQEFHALLVASSEITSISKGASSSGENGVAPLVLSVGATPTTTSIRNLLNASSATSAEETKSIAALQETLDSIKGANHLVELHAGVFPLLDMQQLATSALPSSLLSEKDIGLTIMAEVLSLYPDRTQTPSVLVGAGCLALGRETCKSYSGFGILSPWNTTQTNKWKISYISQEHGILSPAETTSETASEIEKFEIGQKLRIYPNHACIASSHFGWYLVVDEEKSGDVVVDVWVKCRGW